VSMECERTCMTQEDDVTDAKLGDTVGDDGSSRAVGRQVLVADLAGGKECARRSIPSKCE
jgi:hypothetical protein